jgi:hypothetical protein
MRGEVGAEQKQRDVEEERERALSLRSARKRGNVRKASQRMR